MTGNLPGRLGGVHGPSSGGPDAPGGAHGVIALDVAACTACMICVRECPDWCIHLDSHQESVGEPGQRRPRTVNVLDRFAIDWGLCMYCGICVEVCPFDALAWRPEPTPPAVAAPELVHEAERLARRWPGRPPDGPSPAER